MVFVLFVVKILILLCVSVVKSFFLSTSSVIILKLSYRRRETLREDDPLFLPRELFASPVPHYLP